MTMTTTTTTTTTTMTASTTGLSSSRRRPPAGFAAAEDAIVDRCSNNRRYWLDRSASSPLEVSPSAVPANRSRANSVSADVPVTAPPSRWSAAGSPGTDGREWASSERDALSFVEKFRFSPDFSVYFR